MRTIFIEKCNNKTNISKYISEYFPNLSYGSIQKALRNKDIKLNSNRTSKDLLVNIGDRLDIYISDNILYNLPKSLNYIYQDKNILVVYKPDCILSNNEYSHSDEPTLEDLVLKDYPQAKICHRLDRNTSGLIIFALNDTSYNELMECSKSGNITKEYIAYVANSYFKCEHEVLKKFLLKDSKTGFSKIYDEKINDSQEIITEYNVISKNIDLDYAILNVTIHAGKTHQIRAQLANISHHIIGDSKYGKNDVNKKFRKNKQLLFAYRYSFKFRETSPLYYLNNVIVELDSNLYLNKLENNKTI